MNLPWQPHLTFSLKGALCSPVTTCGATQLPLQGRACCPAVGSAGRRQPPLAAASESAWVSEKCLNELMPFLGLPTCEDWARQGHKCQYSLQNHCQSCLIGPGSNSPFLILLLPSFHRCWSLINILHPSVCSIEPNPQHKSPLLAMVNHDLDAILTAINTSKFYQ